MKISVSDLHQITAGGGMGAGVVIRDVRVLVYGVIWSYLPKFLVPVWNSF